jgi:hypothetical protein
MYSNLVEGLSECGVQAELVEKIPNITGYFSDRHASQAAFRMGRKLGSIAQEIRKKNQISFVAGLLEVSANCLWLAWTPFAIFRYQAFLFSFGRSLWPLNLDLPLLRLLRKKIIMNLSHGAEARPAYLDGAYQHYDGGCISGAKKLASLARLARRRVKMSEMYASDIIGNPFSTHYFAQRPFINSFEIGIPQRVDPEINVLPNTGERIRDESSFIVLHAPSDRAAKGSDAILSAIRELQDEGMDIKIRTLSGVKNQEVLKGIKEADLIVDQLFSDTPMAGLATEASAMGKASIVAGYGLRELLPYLPTGLADATITCEPGDIKTTVKETLLSGRYLIQGNLAKNYVAQNLSPTAVAERMVLILEGKVPNSWMVNPFGVTYNFGAGQSKEVSAKQIRGIINLLGIKSLCLEHRIDLESAIVQFARSQTKVQ